MEKVQIIPPPKEVDPRVLAWKGAAVLGKMDSVAELWVSPSDWVCNIFFFEIFADFSLPTPLIGYVRHACSQGKMLLPVNIAPLTRDAVRVGWLANKVMHGHIIILLQQDVKLNSSKIQVQRAGTLSAQHRGHYWREII